jgi:hypothetical protein
MSITRGNENYAEDSTKLKALLRRWREALTQLRGSRRSTVAELPQAADQTADIEPTADVGPTADIEPTTPDRPDRDGVGDAPERQLVPLPDERSQALAVLCDRLLQELDGDDVRGAEIRFVVHKNEHPGHPRLGPESVAAPAAGELAWELRRLIAWSGGAIADVARALEIRADDLDDTARALLQDELAALDADLATVNVHLADPVDWDREFEFLLAGEVAPFDDLSADEDDDSNDSA